LLPGYIKVKAKLLNINTIFTGVKLMENILKKIQSMYPDGTSLDQILKMKLDFSDDNVMKAMMETMREVYDIKVPFNKFIGIKLDSFDFNKLDVRIDMKRELVGNYQRNILHGGVISTVIDLTGGIIVQASILKQMKDNSLMEIAQRFAKISTINLSVDFLLPGSGDYFICTGLLVRLGRTIAVTRTEFYNDKKDLIAIGTANYKAG
jgi:uncharacterized protein (TIGR00369 family)